MVIQRALRLSIFAVLIIIGTAAPARTQGFISPFLGVNFGGVSGCPQLSDCENQQRNLSLSLGKFGSFFGAETEVAYSPKFFGEAPGLSSNVLTMMGNVMLAPKVGPVRPYLLAGTGIMKTRFELRTTDLLSTNDTSFGYVVGGGVFALLGDHFGVRGDVRYYHSFPAVTILGITLRSDKLNFSRAGAGVVFQF
ncbi:MAG: outer membrane beta-barrel protein [Acidobacteriota bacterium]|nr:outer membrane beta-barrel protein [Acidobacteriota bacterium]